MEFQKQIEALNQLVDTWAITSNRNVKGQYTTGDYVEYQLRRIFGPNGWSFTLLSGPEIVTTGEQLAYAQATGRLTVTFANGDQVIQDAVGVWPLKASNARNGGTLENTAPERYETVLKAACTDALKAAAERIGSCFRPLSDARVGAAIGRGEANNGSEDQSAATTRPKVESMDTVAKQEVDSSTGEIVGGNGSGDSVQVDVSPTGYWTLANQLVADGNLTKTKTGGIVTEYTDDGKTDWAAAIVELQRFA